MADTKITESTLLAAGYKEYPVGRADAHLRLFQKRFDDNSGAMYFVNFRYWRQPERTYDAEMACETASHGYVWVTIKEDSIETTELRAGLMWAAAGSVYYDL